MLGKINSAQQMSVSVCMVFWMTLESTNLQSSEQIEKNGVFSDRVFGFLGPLQVPLASILGASHGRLATALDPRDLRNPMCFEDFRKCRFSVL